VTNLEICRKMEIAFTGDLFLGGEFVTRAEKVGTSLLSPFVDTLRITSRAGICVVNLEGPIHSGTKTRGDVMAILCNHVKILEYLKQHKKCIVNLANNHIMDFGEQGLRQTINVLKENGIPYMGAGYNIDEANREIIITEGDKRIAFVAYTSNEPHIRAIIAGHNSAGCATYLDLDHTVDCIRNIKRKADIICVSLHWGHEYYEYPSPDQVRIARALADAGADLIIGHHPHTIQGIEYYKYSLIAYSLGNFFFPDYRMQNGRLRLSRTVERKFMILIARLNCKGQIMYDIKGGFLDSKMRLLIYDGEMERKFVDIITSLSRNIKIDPLEYELFWNDYVMKRKKQLNMEDFYLAVKKMSKMTPCDLLKEIKWSDVRRNLARLSTRMNYNK